MAEYTRRTLPLAPLTETPDDGEMHAVGCARFLLQSCKDLREMDAECRELTFLIEGERLSAWGVHNGDRVRVDPLRPLRVGSLVAAYGGQTETAEEPAIAALNVGITGGAILVDGGGILCGCDAPRIVGPVVAIEPALIRV